MVYSCCLNHRRNSGLTQIRDLGKVPGPAPIIPVILMSCWLQNPVVCFSVFIVFKLPAGFDKADFSLFPKNILSPSLACPIPSLATPSQWLCWFLLIFSHPKKLGYCRPSPLDHLSIFTVCLEELMWPHGSKYHQSALIISRVISSSKFSLQL